MQSRTRMFSAFVLSTAVLFVGKATAADLPQSGSFKLHSGWKTVGDVVQVAENHIFGAGTFWGITYNDAGSGLLHVGTAVCPYTLETINGTGTGQGSCAWGDANGDKIFTSYSGKVSPSGSFEGMNKITGGTGKFNGIQGQAPFQCRALNDKGQYTCTQEFSYSLSAAANR
jgi:hypothetical protein